jgi:hypothetical protein
MKKNLIRISMIAALAAGCGFAQSHTVVQADIPFNFVAGKSSLPAGEYVVRQLDSTPVFYLESREGKKWMLGPVNGAKSADIQSTGKLVFHRYGNTYILSEMWQTGSVDGFRLPKSDLERELMAGSTRPATTTVATR